MKKSIEEMVGDYVRADPIKVPIVMHTKFPATVIVFGVVSSEGGPWIDSVTNEGRLYVFQEDSAPSHKALKTQDWMESLKFSSSCPTKPVAVS
ncbi:hypothetical protein ACTXT7_001524 [Hymenolepis weldensis]